MSIRNVVLKPAETTIATKMYAVNREWTVTAERSAKCVMVYLSTMTGEKEERVRWLPPFAVSVKADVMDQLEWNPVPVFPSTNRGEWDIFATGNEKWISVTVEFDTQQWFDEDACSRFINLAASSDVVFLFVKRELYCDTTRLSAVSSFFSNLFKFTVKERNGYQVEMGETDYDGHLALFLLIHRRSYRITDRNVEAILILADKYDIPDVVFDAFSHLVLSRAIPSIDKLRLSELAGSVKYVDEAISKIEDWDRVCGEKYFPCLSDLTRIKVLERAVRVLNAKLDKVAYSCSGGCRSRINQMDPSQFS